MRKQERAICTEGKEKGEERAGKLREGEGLEGRGGGVKLQPHCECAKINNIRVCTKYKMWIMF